MLHEVPDADHKLFKMEARMRDWCSDEISRLLGSDIGPDLTDYIFSIESVNDVQEYLYQLLDPEDRNVREFVKKVSTFWDAPRKQNTSAVISDDQHSNKENNFTSDQLPQKSPKSESRKQTVITKGEQSPSKRKSHFVSLYSDEGEAKTSVRLPGRHPCECLGQKHKLVNNCLQCGRIVCEQEGSGPCYFCGEVVCTREEQELLAKESKRSQKLKQKLLDSWSEKAAEDEETKRLLKATELKDRLLEYDKTSVRRTKVIDDESDYFASDSKWLSDKERQTLKEKEEKVQQLKHRSRRDMKVTLDFAGRKVWDEDVTSEINDLYNSAQEYLDSLSSTDDRPTNPSYVADGPVYVENDGPKVTSVVSRDNTKKQQSTDEARTALRLQDKELLEMSDTGQCLSMHQPWASLLVHGVKRAEGRTWYSAHRGRLWIAATAKKPSDENITDYENFYRSLGFKDFPQHYPSACLLGCVDVVDCLPQSEYQEKFPNNEESGSPFLFIVENSRELLVKFPVKGQHKIWKLDKPVHQAAKKGLR